MPADISRAIKKLDAAMAIASASEPVRAEIVTTDKEVERYWRVVDRGSVRDEKPWPDPKSKTRIGRDGRVVTKQAPEGFVLRHLATVGAYLKEAIVKVMGNRKAPLTRGQVVEATNQAAEKAFELIRAGAPVDSGKLKNSLAVRKAK